MTLRKCGFCSLSIVLLLFRESLCQLVIKENHLTVQEGSCVTIECTANLFNKGRWFWMKNPKWNGTAKYFSGIIVASSTEEYPVNTELGHRFEYTGMQSFSSLPKSCNLHINNLQKADSGQYAFRVLIKDQDNYMSNYLNLTVKENPCQVNFTKGNSEAKEFEFVSLTCTMSGACDTSPEFTDLKQGIMTVMHPRNTTVIYAVTWQDDGQVVTCQPKANQDKCLARSVQLTVQYAPKETAAHINSTNIKEGDTVFLYCASRGHPNVTFSWFKEGHKQIAATGRELWFNSIRPTDSGNYCCKAKNIHGIGTSEMVTINVKYAPASVSIETNKYTIAEGDNITLTCTKTKSYPEDVSYNWFKNNQLVKSQSLNFWNLTNIMRQNSGSYGCEVKNSAGKKSSKKLPINVQYKPTNTHIIKSSGNQVKVNNPLRLTCQTDASPKPHSYTWVHIDSVESIQWTRTTTEDNALVFEHVGITDTGCYKCSATNSITTGDESSKQCIDVLYGPTEPVLSMASKMKEGSLLSIVCSVQSRPLSVLTLTWSSMSDPLASRAQFLDMNRFQWEENSLKVAFNVTPAQAGIYTCNARNIEGSSSTEKKLDVTYTPRNVNAVAHPSTLVTENAQLTLTCSAQSNPAVSSYTWTRTIAGQTQIVGQGLTLTIRALDLTHSGNYSCKATNEVGVGQSQEVDIKVMYAPKHVEILHNMTSSHERDWRSPVALSCQAQSYPKIRHFKWYRLIKDKEHFVTDHQNLTVPPHEPGMYYCVASNEISGKASDKVKLFSYQPFMMVHQILLILLMFLVLLTLTVYIYRRRKSAQLRPSNSLPSLDHSDFPAWQSGTMEDLVNATGWSDELVPVAPHNPEPQPFPSCPDSTKTSEIHTLYSVLKPPTENKAATPRDLHRERDDQMEDDVIHYVSLHFGDNKKTGQSTTDGIDDLYSKVLHSKPQPTAKNEQRKPHDYENVKGACAPKCNSDTENSEEDVDINYSVVTYKSAGQHHRRRGQCSLDE